jgi:hypothetical protein
LTAQAAKPFRAPAFPTQFTPQPRQRAVLTEKEKEKGFRLQKPRLETLDSGMGRAQFSGILAAGSGQ